MIEPKTLTQTDFNQWVGDDNDAVALTLRQKLVSVESDDHAVIFPPTYASAKKGESSDYNIDTLSDGTKTALIDSVGSQANRLEPLFASAPLRTLVPQVTIKVPAGTNAPEEIVSLFSVGHRLADALLRCTEAKSEIEAAFDAYRSRGDATLIAKLAPTTLVFGAWDSRGEGGKIPRILQSTIRAWDVERLTRSAQYIPPVDYSAHDVFDEQEKAKEEEKGAKSPLAKRGFIHVPSVGAPGGIIARAGVYRDIVLNLIVVRALPAALRPYILGLALAAATSPLDGNLRQGCLLCPDSNSSALWSLVHRDGLREPVALAAPTANDYAQQAAAGFGVASDRQLTFDRKLAKADIAEAKKKKAKEDSEESSGAEATSA